MVQNHFLRRVVSDIIYSEFIYGKITKVSVSIFCLPETIVVLEGLTLRPSLSVHCCKMHVFYFHSIAFRLGYNY